MGRLYMVDHQRCTLLGNEWNDGCAWILPKGLMDGAGIVFMSISQVGEHGCGFACIMRDALLDNIKSSLKRCDVQSNSHKYLLSFSRHFSGCSYVVSVLCSAHSVSHVMSSPQKK